MYPTTPTSRTTAVNQSVSRSLERATNDVTGARRVAAARRRSSDTTSANDKRPSSAAASNCGGDMAARSTGLTRAAFWRYVPRTFRETPPDAGSHMTPSSPIAGCRSSRRRRRRNCTRKANTRRGPALRCGRLPASGRTAARRDRTAASCGTAGAVVPPWYRPNSRDRDSPTVATCRRGHMVGVASVLKHRTTRSAGQGGTGRFSHGPLARSG